MAKTREKIPQYIFNIKNLVFYFLFIPPALALLIISAVPLLLLRIIFYSTNKWRNKKLINSNFSELAEKSSEKRITDMLPIFSELIPKDAKSCLDIGSDRTQSNFYLKKFFDRYITLDIYNADIIQDLNINRKINMKDNSVDIVIVSNILEHLVEPLPIALEANRIAKKYILVGLPNEYTLDKRFSFLFGLSEDKIYPWGHKHRFSLKLSDAFVNYLWGGYASRIYKFNSVGESFIPKFVKKTLLNIYPSFFAGEVFYLVNKKAMNKKEIFQEDKLNKIYLSSFVKEIFHSKNFKRRW